MLTVTVVDVNDNPPAFQHSVYNASVEEGMPFDTFVTMIKATDPDTGQYYVIVTNMYLHKIIKMTKSQMSYFRVVIAISFNKVIVSSECIRMSEPSPLPSAVVMVML